MVWGEGEAAEGILKAFIKSEPIKSMSRLQLLLTWLITNLYPESGELNPIFAETSTLQKNTFPQP